MFTFNAADYAVADPFTPAGYLKPAGSVNSRIFLGVASQKVLARSVQGTALLYWPTPFTTPVIRCGFTLPSSQTDVSDVKGACVITGATANGYAVVHNGLNPGTVEIRTITAGVLATTAIASAAATTGVVDDTFYMDRNPITGEMQVYQQPNGGAPVLKITHTDNSIANTTYVGYSSLAGRITSFFGQGIGGEIVSITNPLVMGSPLTLETTGFTTITSITGAGLSATGVSYSNGTTTAVWPAISESIAPTVALPATNVTITVSDGSNPKTIQADIALVDGWTSVELGLLINDPKYLAGNITLQSGWYIYYSANQAQVSSITIYPDSRIDVDNAGTFTVFLHKLGSGLPLTQYNVTVNAAGEIVTIDTGYNLLDIMKIALNDKGFSGTNSEMYLAWLKANGAIGITIPDAEKEYLIARGVTFTTVLDGWKAYFISKGYSGTLPEMWKTYWLNGAPL